MYEWKYYEGWRERGEDEEAYKHSHYNITLSASKFLLKIYL